MLRRLFTRWPCGQDAALSFGSFLVQTLPATSHKRNPAIQPCLVLGAVTTSAGPPLRCWDQAMCIRGNASALSSDGAGPFCVTKRTWVLLLSYSGTGERLRVRILVFEWLTFLSSGVFLSGWLFRCMYILGRDEKEAVVSIWGLRTLQTLQQRKDAAESVCGH